jgi:hypothetical protein
LSFSPTSIHSKQEMSSPASSELKCKQWDDWHTKSASKYTLWSPSANRIKTTCGIRDSL